MAGAVRLGGNCILTGLKTPKVLIVHGEVSSLVYCHLSSRESNSGILQRHTFLRAAPPLEVERTQLLHGTPLSHLTLLLRQAMHDFAFKTGWVWTRVVDAESWMALCASMSSIPDFHAQEHGRG